MIKYAIMNPELTSYYHSPDYSRQVESYYDSIQQYVTKDGSYIHRAVLVRMKKVRSGFELKLRFGGCRFRWKPESEWIFAKSFKWLGFCLTYSTTYRDGVDKIIKDHYADYLLSIKDYEN